MSGEKLNLVISNNKKIETLPPIERPKETILLPQLGSNHNQEDSAAAA
jgi:hypothetical protein